MSRHMQRDALHALLVKRIKELSRGRGLSGGHGMYEYGYGEGMSGGARRAPRRRSASVGARPASRRTKKASKKSTKSKKRMSKGQRDWQAQIKRTARANPDMARKDVLRLASAEYRGMGGVVVDYFGE